MNNLNWPTRKLDDVCELQRGSEPGSKTYNEKGEGVRFIRVADVSKHRTNPIWTTRKDLVPCKKDDILMTFDGSLGVVFRGIEGAISSGIRIIKPKNNRELLDDFLFYILQTEPVQNTVKKYTIGVSILHASKSIPHIEIPLPPIKIQKRIVARIEELFEKIDKAKKLRQKALEEAGQIFPAALEEIFKKAVRKYSKQEIEEILELNQSGIWGDKPEELKNSYPVIRSTEITHEGELNLNSVAIRKIVPNKVSKYSLADGDILIVKSSGSANLIGRCSLFKQSKEDKKIYLFSNFIQRLRPNTKIVIPEFLYYFLNFEGKKFVQYLMTTTTGLRNLPIKQYVKLQIPHPSLPEQKKIVVYLDSLREKVDKLKQFQQSQLKELTELKQSILAKAFKG